MTEVWRDSNGRAKSMGLVWELRKGLRVARCELHGHPLGVEARVAVDGDLKDDESLS